MKENLGDELKKRFKPEFINRIDGQVVFHPLSSEQIRAIVDLMMKDISHQLAEKEVKLEITDAAKDFLGEKGYDEEFGARPLRRTIRTMVEDRLSESILRGEFKEFERIYELKAVIPNEEIRDNVFNTLRGMEWLKSGDADSENAKIAPRIFQTELNKDTITVYANKSVKWEVEKIIKAQLKEAGKGKISRISVTSDYKLTEYSFISYVVIDVRQGEIIIESKESFNMPNMPVGAAS